MGAFRFFLMLFFIVLPVSSCGFAQPSEQRSPTVGGACSYKAYPGWATIVLVKPKEEASGRNEKRFEVNFSFLPDDKIEEDFARTEGKMFPLYDEHLRHPDAEFIDKHQIRTGYVLRGTLEVITRGTCTPAFFNFPDLTSEK
jgi:hypothetical protein